MIPLDTFLDTKDVARIRNRKIVDRIASIYGVGAAHTFMPIVRNLEAGLMSSAVTTVFSASSE